MIQNSKSGFVPTLILGVLFFIFGFVTWLNGTLIPYLKIACELNTFQSLLVAFAFYISYFVMALPSSWILKKTSFKKGMMLGLLVMAIGALLFIPAAQNRLYPVFLVGLFIIGTGLSILQTASNPYITIVGPIESAAKRISIMGICNKVAGVLAPLILGSVILSDADSFVKNILQVDLAQKTIMLNELASRVILPYLLMAVSLVFLALLIRFSPLPEIESQDDVVEESTSAVEKTSIFQFPNLILGVITLFLYVGVEVIAGDTIILYGQHLAIPITSAKYFTSLTLICMIIGYIIGISTIPKYIKQNTALAISAILGILFGLAAILVPSSVSFHLPFIDLVTFKQVELIIPVTVLFISLLGIANALMWPAIWPLAINGLGKFTKTGSAMLIMAIAGGALLPLLYGRLADIKMIGSQNAYWIMIPCYIFILFYSIKGYSYKNWSKKNGNQ